MDALSVSEGRLRALFAAGLAVTAELSLDALLHRIVEAAAELTGARYAALGVIDANGSELEQFVTHGIDDELRAEIGELPRGRGILGVLIREARPLRLHDLADDPRSVGFPPGHPPMRGFLGVPILVRGVAYGNLYLTEKQGGEDFTDEDQELVTLLAGQAAVAIENARLYEASTRWSRQLQSLQEVGNALATETDLDRLLDLVVRRLRELLKARVVVLALPTGGDELRFAAAAGEGAQELLGTTISRSGSKSGAVLERRRSERVDSVMDDPEVHQEVSRRLAARTGMWVPLVARERAIGVLEIHDKEGSDARFSHDDFRLAETFAARAAVAVELSQRMARDALRRVVQAQELERRRLARELHDETGQALTSILLGLKPLEEALADHPARDALAELREHVVSALQDVRRLAVELRPAVLDDYGLVPALERLTESFAEPTGMRVDFHSALGETRLPGEVETALYRVVQESLTNIVKHANARSISVSVARRGSVVAAVIEDDGSGFDPRKVGENGIGLLGMRERLALIDGRLEIESRPGAGTTIVAEVPSG
ncbi:MAG TPA: GAF domain-containing protein [Gaiellaceae bacterium]|nr:GAF domain-containing protein [Gaiellaceae bacterium]